MRQGCRASPLVALGLGGLAFAARVLPVLRGGGLHGVLAYDDGVYFGSAEAFVFGRLPYRDFVLLHPPGIVLALSPFAWLARLRGDDDTGLAVARLAFMCVGAVNAVLVYRVARGRLGEVAGIVGGLFYAVWEPAVYAERTTLLEPLVNLGVLSGLLLVGDPRSASRRRVVAAGVALGLATAVKLWAVVPLVVLFGWVVVVRRRASPAFALGAAAAATMVCLPFFLAAPQSMLRLVVLDQLGRTNNAVPWSQRLAGITTAVALDRVAPKYVTAAAVAFAALALLVAVVLVRCLPAARPWCALLAAQGTLLLLGPSYFPHYATYVAPALALVVGATAGLAVNALRQRGAPAVSAVLTAGVLAAGCLLAVSEVRPEGNPGPDRATRLQLAGAGCVAADAPAALESADVLGRDLRDGCVVLVDPTGLTYDQDRGDLRSGHTRRARRHDVEWQHRIGRWFARSQVVIVQRRNPDGLSRPTLQTLAGADNATRRRRYDVYVTR